MELSKAEAREHLQSLYKLYDYDFDRVQKDMLLFFERMKREKEKEKESGAGADKNKNKKFKT